MHGRVVPEESAALLRHRAHQQKMRLRRLRAARNANMALSAVAQAEATSGWKSLGPSPLASDATGFGGQDYGWVSGRATAVAIDPADPTGNTVYLGGAYGGVWKSSNAGAASANAADVVWTSLTDDQATLAVGSIAIQPGNNDPTKSVILVGTGETNSAGDSYYGLGILRSADAGATWTLVSQDSTTMRSFAGLGFSKIAFSTVNPNFVVAAAAGATEGVIEGRENPVNKNRGLYYSTDAGKFWTYASIKDGTTTIEPTSATTVVYNEGAKQLFAAIRWHGFYSSSDGINWTRLSNQPGNLPAFLCPATAASQDCPIYRGELAVVPGRNEMYAWYVDNDDTDQGIWQTKDGGLNWTPINDNSITNCGDQNGCGTSRGGYNLTLAAVPDGTATDLYAGTVNIYKCRIDSLSSTCSGTGPNTFLNLTHAYGCPSISHVHPDQHAIASIKGAPILYFANDGGIYRALDGYLGLTAGACGETNQFDSLNQTLGSMTQFISFSQHPTDPNTILGGTQGNGSAATSTALLDQPSWIRVNAADGGYTAISPENPTEWFTSNTGVSIQRCTLGVNCRQQDFDLVVSNFTLQGDLGAFYTPFILDPQNSGELLVGTCRVWRGASDGQGFTVLTNNFETGGDGGCTGSEVNLIRALGAGGPKDTNGFSNVIYAGTDGFGPMTPTGGHIWVSTNADAGPSNWVDRTGSINPKGFPISAIAVDRSDGLGNTAYVTIMGFHVSHVWKTTNAGASWTDFTGNLPDAPANTVLVDAGTVYVGTDVGVWSRGTGGTANPDWTEVEPASGTVGFLPNVPVTALQMFNSGGTRKLRASTYGRGIWEFTLAAGPDFQISVPQNTLTIFAGQSATFTGTITPEFGYNSSVDLSCAQIPNFSLPTCSVDPSNIPPSTQTTTFQVTASGVAADYFFNLHGEGQDTPPTRRNVSLALHVIDFDLSAPAPAGVVVKVSRTSDPISFQVTAEGVFNAPVTLSCSGLPAGAACIFQPSTVTPSAGAPEPTTLTISTTADTPIGTFPIMISADTPGAPSPKTQILSLQVVTFDFSLTTSTGTRTIQAGQGTTYNLRVEPISGDTTFPNKVTFSCTGLPSLSEFSFAPAQVASGARASDVVLTISTTAPSPAGTPPGSYHVIVTAVSGTVTHTVDLTLIISGSGSSFDFAIVNNSRPQTIQAGQTASYDLDVRPLDGSTAFPQDVTLSCSSLPPLGSCSFTPAQVGHGSGDTNVVLRVVTTAPVLIAQTHTGGWQSLWFILPASVFASLPGMVIRRKRLALLPILLAIALLPACGGGNGSGGGAGQPGTPSGDYTITVNATCGSITRSALAQLKID